MHARKIISYLLIGLFFSISSVAVQAHAWSFLGAGTPTLQVGTGITAHYNELVTVPIAFSSNGTTISSVLFAIDFDESCLHYESAEFSLNIPSAFAQVIDAQFADAEGIIDFSITYADPAPFQALPDLDPIVELSFTTICEPAPNTSIIALPVGFSEPSTRSGDLEDESVAGTTVGDVVTILGITVDTATPTVTATGTPDNTATPTVVPTGTPTKVRTPRPTATKTPRSTATPTSTATGTATATATNTAVNTPTGTTVSTNTPTVTVTPTATNTPTLPPTATNSVTPNPTTTTVPLATPTPTPTHTPTRVATATATHTSTPTATVDPGKTIIADLTGNVLTDSIEIRWQTTQEINSEGFYLYRNNPTVNETYVPLTGLLSSKGTSGGSYLSVDNEVEPGVNYSYLLVERKRDGTLIEYHELVIVLGLKAPDALIRNYLPLVLR